MKKIIVTTLFFIFSLFFVNMYEPAQAVDIIPLSSKSIKYYGIGVLNMPQSYKVYKNPYFDAEIVRHVNYEGFKKSAIVNTVDMRKVSYVAHVPENNVALLTVEFNPENDWYCVYIDQKTGETGWVHNPNKQDFFTYRQLFYFYGKKYGLRIFNDLSEDEKVLRAKAEIDSQVLYEFTYPKFISFTIIYGNWLLANVNDVSSKSVVGWYNWRNEDGTLNMFPNFREP